MAASDKDKVSVQRGLLTVPGKAKSPKSSPGYLTSWQSQGKQLQEKYSASQNSRSFKVTQGHDLPGNRSFGLSTGGFSEYSGGLCRIPWIQTVNPDFQPIKKCSVLPSWQKETK